MHSLILSEPIGIAIGIVAGRYGAKIGKDIAKKIDIPVFFGAVFGAFLTHYLTSVIVKGLINAGMFDVPGAGVNIAVSSPLAAGGHGMIEGLLELVPELGNMIENAVTNELPAILEEVTNEVNADSSNHFQSSSGGETYFGRSNPDYPITEFADFQGFGSPTCGYEMIENIIQIYNPNVPNNFSDSLIQFLSENGNPEIDYANDGLPTSHYESILEWYNIPSQWLPYSTENILASIFEPNNSVGIVGDPSYLNEAYSRIGENVKYSLNQYHAITLVDPWYSSDSRLIGYLGIDSNVAGKEIGFTFEEVQNMVLKSKNGIDFNGVRQILATKISS